MAQTGVVTHQPVVTTGQPVHATPVAVAPASDPSGNAQLLAVDSSGNLKCSVTGAGSGGTSAVDGTPFVAGTSAGTPLMAEDPTSGDLLIAQMAPGTRILASQATVTPPTSTTGNTPTQKAVGVSSGQIFALNASAKGRRVMNTGTTIIYIGLNQTPTVTAYHVALAPGFNTNDGSGGVWDGTISGCLFQGIINAIGSAAGGTCVVTELT
jgi:hypothetical protein